MVDKMLKRIIIFLFLCTQANALPLIRDAEVETTLKEYFAPVFAASGVNPNIYIINSPVLNAFVAGGQNIFIHTGLILEMERPEMLIGVVAHETAHITGGHLISHKKEAESITAKAMLGYILGAAAAAAGAGDAGVAIMSAGSTYAATDYMAYSRTTEQVADRAAIEFLNQANISVTGLADTFELLRREEKVRPEINAYIRTHPITTQRIMNIRSHIPKDDKTPPLDDFKFKRLQAKLDAFLGDSSATLQKYTTDSFIDRYARTIAYYKIGKIDKSIKEADALIKNYPNDPFVYELKGQVLFENARFDEAVKSYAKAFELFPHPLIRYGLGVAQISAGGNEQVNQGINNINSAMVLDKSLPGVYHHLSVGYNKLGNKGMELLSLAESEMRKGNKARAMAYGQKALKTIPENTPAYFKASDFIKAHQEEDE